MLIKPEIAVVVPCYNLGRTLEEAVDSILVQTRPAAEILVIDDGSTDPFTRQVLHRLTRPKTRVATFAHQGVARARNHGVSLTRTPYIVLLDADDVLAPTYLEKLGERLDTNPAIGFVSSDVQAFEGASYRWKPPSTTAVGTLARGSVHISTMFRRSLWDAVGGFDAELPGYEDLDFWLHAIQAGYAGEIVDEPLLFYRIRSESRYRDALEPEIYRHIMRRIIDRHRPLIEAHGLDVLREKEAFLIEIIEYRDGLLLQRDDIRARLRKLDDEIAAFTRELDVRVGSAASAASPAFESLSPAEAMWRSSLQAFFERWRWLVRGTVTLLSDVDSLLDTLPVPRWDSGVPGTIETRLPLRRLDAVRPASQDCVIAILASPTESLDNSLKALISPLKPGGTLLVAVPALQQWQVEETPDRPHPSDFLLRGALARVFPLEAFDVEVAGAVACAIGRLGAHNRVPFRSTSLQTRRTPSGSGIVLAYHRIAELQPDTYRLCVSPRHFRQHMRYLQEYCTVMPLVELCLAARDGALPPRAVAVTFDDGYLDALTHAAPILSAEGVYGTFFVNTERIDEHHEAWHDELERLLHCSTLPPALELQLPNGLVRLDLVSLEQCLHAQQTLHAALWCATAQDRRDVLRQLADASGGPLAPRHERRLLVTDEIQALALMRGCEIGSHSEHHLVLPHFDEATQQTELRSAKLRLEEMLDRPVVSFAYPFGEHDVKLARLVAETPYLLAVTVEAGLVTPSTDPMLIPRLEISDGDETRFAQTLEGLFGHEQIRPVKASAVVVHHNGNGSPECTGIEAADRAWAQNDIRSREEHAAGAVVLSAMPQFLIIDPTSRCNARCVMCPVSFRASGDHGVDLSPAIFEKLTPLLPTATHVNIFSTGEPTIAQDIVPLIDQAKERSGSRTVICMSTNGKWLPTSVLERLLAPRMGLQFSVDGGTKEVFESIRRGIKFEDICRSLDMAKRARGELPYPAFSFSSTISKRNIHDLANIFDLAKRYGINHVYFYEEDPEIPEEESFILEPRDRAVFESQLERINQTGVPYSNGLYFRGRDGLRAVNPPPPANTPPLHCSAPWKVFHQRADGTVRTCCTLRQSMGDLRHQTFDEVWNGEAYMKLRRAFVEESDIPDICYRCTDPLRTFGG